MKTRTKDSKLILKADNKDSDAQNFVLGFKLKVKLRRQLAMTRKLEKWIEKRIRKFKAVEQSSSCDAFAIEGEQRNGYDFNKFNYITAC